MEMSDPGRRFTRNRPPMNTVWLGLPRSRPNESHTALGGTRTGAPYDALQSTSAGCAAISRASEEDICIPAGLASGEG
jgi:hypothetical protein